LKKTKRPPPFRFFKKKKYTRFYGIKSSKIFVEKIFSIFTCRNELKCNFSKKKFFLKKIFFFGKKKVDNFGRGGWPVGFPVKLQKFRLKPAI